MKKFSIFMLIGAMTMMLCSCGDKKKSNSDNSANTGTQYADLGLNVYEDGLIYYDSGIINYLDFETMESTIICAKPNCDHKKSDCVAREAGECPIIYNGYLYFFESTQGLEELGNGKREFKINSKLCRISLDSSEKEELVSFNDCVPRDYDGWIVNDNVIWFTGDDMNPTPDEYGAIEYGNAGGTHFICSIDLNSMKYTNYGSVYDGDKEYEAASNTSSAQIKGLYESKIMIRYEFAKEPVPIQPDENFDYRSVLEELMFEFDTETKELKPSDLKEPVYVDENTYIYLDNEKTYVIDEGKTYEFDCYDNFDISFINGKFFNGTDGIWYDTSDMSEHSMGKYAGYMVTTSYDDCYILNKGNKEMIKLTESELLALE